MELIGDDACVWKILLDKTSVAVAHVDDDIAYVLRSTEVFLTPRGRKIAQEIESAFTSHLQENLAELPSESKKVLLEGIKLLLKQFFDDQRQDYAELKK